MKKSKKNVVILKVKKYIYLFLVIGIFGNKSDLVNEEEVDEIKVREFAKDINALFQRTSARNGTGINDSFMQLIKNYFKDNKNEKDNKGAELKNISAKKKSSWC